MMKWKFLIAFFASGLMFFSVAGMAHAIDLNEEGTLTLNGKVQTKLTFKTRDSKGWSTWDDPFGVADAWGVAKLPDLDAWDLKQHRNIAYLELDYKMKKSSGVNLKFHATGRFLYDGVYDYGPDEMQAVRETNESDIDDMVRDVDLWECYVDVTKGPLFFRVGRQKISWGETDVYPMLDRIMPIDNTYGGIFEDLDDRRIPLWALRSSYNFGDVGPFESLSIEAFWNPGFADQQFTPQAPFGSIYTTPQPRPNGLDNFVMRYIEPDDDMKASRYGVRLQGILASNFNWSIVHIKTFLDEPALQMKLDDTGAAALLNFLGAGPPGPISYTDPRIVNDDHYTVHQVITPIHITGGSFSFFESNIEAVMRGEVAYFKDEPAFTPTMNFKPLFNLLGGGVMPSIGGTLGEVPEQDVLRFSVAVDKPIWVRAINRRAMINVTLELFNEYYMDYDDNLRIAAPVYPDTAETTEYKEWEHTLVCMMSTNYMSGRLTPTILAGYNPQGSGFVQPSIEYRMDPFIFKVHYAHIFGNNDSIPGILNDWDQLSFSATFLF